MTLEACLNGSRNYGEHPRLPVTPLQLADDAAECVEAGASRIHLHPRDADGWETLGRRAVADAVFAVRQQVPGTLISVTTGLWITDDDATRHAAVWRWAGLPATGRPDVATVNLWEPGAADLIDTLRAAGIGVEIGLHCVADVTTAVILRQLGHHWVRVLVEIPPRHAEVAVHLADRLLSRLRDAGIGGPTLLHGEGESCWPLLTHAVSLGLDCRIGLEDSLTLPDGTGAPDNAAMVAVAHELVAASVDA